ncbi:MAG: nucleotidyltransferase domain-containing protein [Chloroflexi bacterium]|nr:nucleotidyltransferase domain-containing protein [Chloroflexota bacterium]
MRAQPPAAYRVNAKRLKTVAEEFRLELIVLFGSYAKGRAVAGRSDVDVAVRFAPGVKRRRAVDMLDSALYDALSLKADLDLTVLNDAGALLLFQVARTGIVLYQTRLTTFSLFRLYAFQVYDDHQPFFAARERYMKARYG